MFLNKFRFFLEKFSMGHFQEMKNAPRQGATRKCRDDNLHSNGIFLLTIILLTRPHSFSTKKPK